MVAMAFTMAFATASIASKVARAFQALPPHLMLSGLIQLATQLVFRYCYSTFSYT